MIEVRDNFLPEDVFEKIKKGIVYCENFPWFLNRVLDLSIDTPEVTTLVITDEDIAIMERNKLRKSAKQYLAETDWYVTRNAETGKTVPGEILAKRAQARLDAGE